MVHLGIFLMFLMFCRYLDPIFFGDYPKVMREILGDHLPKFSDEDKKLLRTPIDFVGLNHYTSRFIAHVTKDAEHNNFYHTQQIDRIGNTFTVTYNVVVFCLSNNNIHLVLFYSQLTGQRES